MREYEVAMVEIDVRPLGVLNVEKARRDGECSDDCHLFFDRGARVGERDRHEERMSSGIHRSLVVRGIE